MEIPWIVARKLAAAVTKSRAALSTRMTLISSCLAIPFCSSVRLVTKIRWHSYCVQVLYSRTIPVEFVSSESDASCLMLSPNKFLNISWALLFGDSNNWRMLSSYEIVYIWNILEMDIEMEINKISFISFSYALHQLPFDLATSAMNLALLSLPSGLDEFYQLLLTGRRVDFKQNIMLKTVK